MYYIRSMTTTHNTTARIAWGSVRCSTQMQADSGLGLAAERRKIEDYCAANGITLLGIVEDAAQSGAKSWRKREGISKAVAELTAGNGSMLIAANVSRLGRNTADVLSLVEVSKAKGFTVVAIDSPLDLSTPAGVVMFSMLASFAQYEREMISERTRLANAEKRARGERTAGPRSMIAPEARALMVARRTEGATLREIAAELTEAGYVTGHGKKVWTHGNVQMALKAYRVTEAGAVKGDPCSAKRGPRPRVS